MWPLGSIWILNYVLIEILLIKVRHRKCDPLRSIDRPNLHNYILIRILLKKVRRRKCDPLFVEDLKYLWFLRIKEFYEHLAPTQDNNYTNLLLSGYECKPVKRKTLVYRSLNVNHETKNFHHRYVIFWGRFITPVCSNKHILCKRM